MLYTTQGIVLHTIDYSENSSIVKIYTHQFGLSSFIINRIRSKKEKKNAALQSLAMVELVCDYHQKKELQKITEIRNAKPFQSIPFDIVKSSIALFINEIIYRSIHEQEPNENLFYFLCNTIEMLDNSTENCVNFHLLFMLQFSKYLGFYPQGIYSEKNIFFDLQEGAFVANKPVNENFISPPLTEILSHFLTIKTAEYYTVKMTNEQRRKLLEKIIAYFHLHLDTMKNIKSHQVLEQVME
ncbi:MAG TPA: DNA repair protein RecO [Bacteroidia bacterium]|nr:DNA repair protein RecO [Bacteroidia bacterium]